MQLAILAACALGSATASAADAGDGEEVWQPPPPVRLERPRRLATAGMVLGVSGPVVAGLGLAASAVQENRTLGRTLLVTGVGLMATGPALLSVSGFRANRAFRFREAPRDNLLMVSTLLYGSAVFTGVFTAVSLANESGAGVRAFAVATVPVASFCYAGALIFGALHWNRIETQAERINAAPVQLGLAPWVGRDTQGLSLTGVF